MRKYDPISKQWYDDGWPEEGVAKPENEEKIVDKMETIEPPKEVATPPVQKWKYNEDQIISDLEEYLKTTFGAHYSDGDQVECFDAWNALGDSTPTYRNTAIKYLWRYGKKNGNNKADLLKAMHYIIMMLHVDHYKK